MSRLLLVGLMLHLAPAFCEMTNQNRIDILNSHNSYRASLVETTSMIKMTYDMNLEKVAQEYANSGQRPHNAQRTAQYAALGGSGYVGENWYSGSPTDFTEKMTNFEWPKNWGGNGCSEMQNYLATYENNRNDLSHCKGGTVGHYTQVMWHSSARVGCGYTQASGTYCNYAPGGNVGGYTNVYTKGTPCSNCPSEYPVCSNGLCAAADYNAGTSDSTSPSSGNDQGGGGIPSADSKSYECDGDEHFVVTQAPYCGNCVRSDQCAHGYYCCPYMKKCVSSGSQGCYTPIAKCNPPCQSEDPEQCSSCENADFPDNWVTCRGESSPRGRALAISNPTDARELASDTLYTIGNWKTYAEDEGHDISIDHGDDLDGDDWSTKAGSYDCNGATDFVPNSAPQCGNCVNSEQCEGDMFCCPFMKKCVPTSSTGCYQPIANCRPPCQNSDPTQCACTNGDFPNNWVSCPEDSIMLGGYAEDEDKNSGSSSSNTAVIVGVVIAVVAVIAIVAVGAVYVANRHPNPKKSSQTSLYAKMMDS